MKLVAYTCEECDSDCVYCGGCNYCPQCGKEGDGPYPQEGLFQSKGTQNDPLKHFRFWIPHNLGVEYLSEFGDAYQLLENIQLLMIRVEISTPLVKDCTRW